MPWPVFEFQFVRVFAAMRTIMLRELSLCVARARPIATPLNFAAAAADY